jgi:periplasmic protein TonB
MATITEIAKTEVRTPVRQGVNYIPMTVRAKAPFATQYRVLFSDSILENAALEMHGRRRWTTALSFSFQCILLGIMVLIPLWFTEALPKAQLLTFLVAPPPPPPPPPAVTQAITKVIRQTDVLSTGQLRTPTRIPQKIEMIKEEEAPPPVPGGVVGGVPGGIPGGQLGGVIGGIISSTSSSIAAVPKLEPVKRVRVSQGVTQGLLLQKVEPKYPKIALAARITGVVLLKAVISKDGTIKELQVVTGHPMLIPSALDAVKQWRYRPYLLNGEPVEVETNITVTFMISS